MLQEAASIRKAVLEAMDAIRDCALVMMENAVLHPAGAAPRGDERGPAVPDGGGLRIHGRHQARRDLRAV